MKQPPSGLLQRRSLLQTGALALLLGVRHRAHAATILAVRVWPGDRLFPRDDRIRGAAEDPPLFRHRARETGGGTSKTSN
jgi:hypothetical protein